MQFGISFYSGGTKNQYLFKGFKLNNLYFVVFQLPQSLPKRNTRSAVILKTEIFGSPLKIIVQP